MEIIGWILGGSFIVAALGLFQLSVLAGLIGIFAGLRCLPPVTYWLNTKTKEPEKGKAYKGSDIGAGVFFWVVAAMFAGATLEKEQAASTQSNGNSEVILPKKQEVAKVESDENLSFDFLLSLKEEEEVKLFI